MIFCGIDIAKDKHDCHIFSSDGEILCDNFSFPNGQEKWIDFVLKYPHVKCISKKSLSAFSIFYKQT